MPRIPRKLKNDPIVEALFEVRFASDQIPEVVLGKLASRDCWTDYKTVRLALADIPAAIRDNDPNLVYQPLWQLQANDGKRVIKSGPRVFSYHVLQPYPGWAVFEPELVSATDFLFGILGPLTVMRYGFRYINVLTKDHFVTSLANLNFGVRLADAPVTWPINLNYQRGHSSHHRVMVRVAPKEFVQNPTEGLGALIDIDVFTPTDFKSDGSDKIKWVGEAHKFLKEEFFTLLPDALIDRLEEK